MRITSDLFVSALVRRVFGLGGFAAVIRRGSTEAGAVYLLRRSRLGLVTLYGPAPQSSYEGRPDERLFHAVVEDGEEADIEARLAREARFDPDLWVVEIEADGLPDDLIPLSRPEG
ncbi:MAG: DUF1491 family protein [Rhizobiaceae bacterium]|nr:DUF1491 family protein [Rhizobiaceae bacterium]MCV0405513.1 DUF1491 family protein [Rhizobiaceae bacterium]